MKTTIEIPDDLFRRTKATAAMAGMTLKKLVIAAIEQHLERQTGGAARATGWRTVVEATSAATEGEVDAIAADSVDPEERLVLPSAVRERAGFGPGTELEIRCRDGRVEIEPAPREVRIERRGKLMVAVPKDPSDPLSEDDVRRTRDDLRSRNAGRT
jgi:AbrB family looped-hinge helix DNA binding protein